MLKLFTDQYAIKPMPLGIYQELKLKDMSNEEIDRFFQGNPILNYDVIRSQCWLEFIDGAVHLRGTGMREQPLWPLRMNEDEIRMYKQAISKGPLTPEEFKREYECSWNIPDDPYWYDERGRLYCKHGIILYGNSCVQCERGE